MLRTRREEEFGGSFEEMTEGDAGTVGAESRDEVEEGSVFVFVAVFCQQLAVGGRPVGG